MASPREGATKKGKRVVVLGGGPIGVELACRAAADGWSVTLVEQDCPLAHVRAWGHVTLFSPWELNTTAHGLAILDAMGVARPNPEIFPTGHELVDQYLGHLWQWLAAQAHVSLRPHTKAMAASRAGGVTKGTMGQGKRQAQVFEVLVASSSTWTVTAAAAKRKKMEPNEHKGEVATDENVENNVLDGDGNEEEEQEEEEVLEGEALIDCTGNFGQRKWLGPGGRPAVGERAANGRIHASVPDVKAHPEKFLGKRVLIVGGGYSAITAIGHVSALVDAQNDNEDEIVDRGAEDSVLSTTTATTTTVVWVTRPLNESGEVYTRVPNDVLPGRDRLAILGNQLASLSSSSSSSSQAAHTASSASSDSTTSVRADTADNSANQSQPEMRGKHAFVVKHMPGAQVLAIQPLHRNDKTSKDAEDGIGADTGRKRAKTHSGTQLAVTLMAAKSSSTNPSSSKPDTENGGEEEKQEKQGSAQVSVFDQVVSAAGYRPDITICQELQVHYCYATEGPMKLAAAMMAANGGGGGDCLAQVAPGPATLVSPEPNFYVLGMKSYGRGSAFLLKIGHEQIEMVMGLLNEKD